jgi:hypothetical protein
MGVDCAHLQHEATYGKISHINMLQQIKRAQLYHLLPILLPFCHSLQRRVIYFMDILRNHLVHELGKLLVLDKSRRI